MKKTLITIVLAAFLLSMPIASEGRTSESSSEPQENALPIASFTHSNSQIGIGVGIGRRRRRRVRRRLMRRRVIHVYRRNRGRQLRRRMNRRRARRGGGHSGH